MSFQSPARCNQTVQVTENMFAPCHLPMGHEGAHESPPLPQQVMETLGKVSRVSAEDVRLVREAQRLTREWFADWTLHQKDDWRIRLQQIMPALDASDAALARLEARLAEAERERDDAEQSWSMYAKEAEDANTRAEEVEVRLARLERIESRAWAIFNPDGTLDHVEVAKLNADLRVLTATKEGLRLTPGQRKTIERAAAEEGAED